MMTERERKGEKGRERERKGEKFEQRIIFPVNASGRKGNEY